MFVLLIKQYTKGSNHTFTFQLRFSKTNVYVSLPISIGLCCVVVQLSFETNMFEFMLLSQTQVISAILVGVLGCLE